jgi:histone-lysine N-methyltransferase SETMAR
VTGDEKWVLYNNVCRKRQWLSPGQKAVPTPKQGLHPRKILLCVWWDIRGVIFFELIENKRVNSQVYCEQLTRLKQAIAATRPRLTENGVVFHHDNASAHTSKMTKKKIQDLRWDPLSHPPYSPDLAPTDYHLFRSLQHFLAGKTFKTKEDIEESIGLFFSSKPIEFFEHGIEQLPMRWRDVVKSKGRYLE